MRTLCLLVCMLISAAGFTTEARAAADARPNIVLILADDLGWTGLGSFGSDLYHTPHLDRLAAEGMRFTSAYSACTVCSPTRAALMTGKYPARLRVTDWIPGLAAPQAKLKIPDWTKHLPGEETSLAELLKQAEYATAMMGKWHLGGEGSLPQDHGFDVNVGGTHQGSPPGGYFLPNQLALADANEGEYLTDYLGRKAAAQIEQWKDRPFFLYLPHYAVHTPIQGKPALTEKYKRLLKAGLAHDNPVYAGMTESLDDAVGAVLKKLDELKLTERTIVIFTSDNGGWSHNGGTPTGITLNEPLRRGKGSAYEGGTRVPLIIRWPGVAKPGSVSDEPVITMDLTRTLMEAVAGSGETAVDGRSLMPLLKDPSAALASGGGRDLFWHYPHYHRGGDSPYGAVRSGPWKLIEFYEDNRVELYNLADDLSEANDLAAKMPDKAQQMREKLHAWRESVAAQMPTPNPEYVPGVPGGPREQNKPAKAKRKKQQ